MTATHTVAGDTKSRLARLAAAGVLALGAMTAWAGAAEAQSTISSTGGLKQACETSPGHVVNASSDMKISSGVMHSGAFAPSYEQVSTGCTIQLSNGAKFETDGVAMSFDGPFDVQSAGKGGAIFSKSAFKATSMNYDLDGGSDSDFKTSESRLDATTGGINVATGNDGEVQLQYMAGTVNALKAAGPVNISGGDKLFVDVFNTGVSAGGKLNINMTGQHGVFKTTQGSFGGGQGLAVGMGGGVPILTASQSDFSAGGGGVSITGAAPKSLVELNTVRLMGRGDHAIRLTGAEAALKSFNTRFQSGVGRVDLLAGGPGASIGLVELVQPTFFGPAGVSVQASPDAQKGTVKIGGANLHTDNDLLVKSGAMGTTEVKESSIWAQTAIRILTGQGGNCLAEKNSVIAPTSAVQQICQ